MKTIHVKYVMDDWWGNPIYKCEENGRLYKDVDWDYEHPHLCTFDNSDLDAEAEAYIRSDIEVIVTERRPL